MSINRNNYEAWFLDYAEGNLSEEQIAELFLFLESHPDLKEEFEEELEVIPLKPDNISIPSDDLKREQQVGFINRKNYEEYLIGLAEGDLTEAEHEELVAFLKKHPELEIERAVYAGMRLEVDESVVFPNKAALKKQAEEITVSNYEDYLIAAAEGDLNPAEEKQLAAFLEANPEVEAERATYASIHLNPDFHLQYLDKEKLKQRDGRVIPLYYRYAAAAAAVVLLCIGIYYEVNKGNSVPVLADMDQGDVEQVIPITYAVAKPHYQPAWNERPVFENEQEVIQHNYVPQSFLVRDQDSSDSPTEPVMYDVADDIPLPDPVINDQDSAVVPDGIELEPMDESIAAVPNSEPYTLWEYAGVTVKEKVLNQDDVEDGKIRENDIANAFTKGADLLTSQDVAFEDNSNDEVISYGFNIGKFGFSRTKPKN